MDTSHVNVFFIREVINPPRCDHLLRIPKDFIASTIFFSPCVMHPSYSTNSRGSRKHGEKAFSCKHGEKAFSCIFTNYDSNNSKRVFVYFLVSWPVNKFAAYRQAESPNVYIQWIIFFFFTKNYLILFPTNFFKKMMNLLFRDPQRKSNRSNLMPRYRILILISTKYGLCRFE